jgi:hypothetical protein
MRTQEKIRLDFHRVHNIKSLPEVAMRYVLAVFLSLFMSVAALAADPTEAQKQAMQSVVGAQLEAFREGRHADAFSHAAPSIQALFGDVDNFIMMVRRGFAPVYSNKDFTFANSFTDNSGRFAQRVVIDGKDGKRYEALYTLEQLTDGSWKITSCTLLETKSEGV